MPPLSKHPSQDALKILLLGDSGTGKTGALASLAEAGFKLRILDYDNGLDILAGVLSPEAKERVSYITLVDKIGAVGGKQTFLESPQAFSLTLKYLEHWAPPGEDLGRPRQWEPDTIIVIDSLTFLGVAAMHLSLAMNPSKEGGIPRPRWNIDYPNVFAWLESFLAAIYGGYKCNVIMTAHTNIKEEEDPTEQALVTNDKGKIVSEPKMIRTGLPLMPGQKISPKIGTYFNTMFLCKLKGVGASAKRVILTETDGIFPLKNPNPKVLPKELDQTTGLAKVFDLLKITPKGETK